VNLTLSAEEVQSLTGYKRPGDQLAELRRQGFYRARIGRLGGVILERNHYDAVTSGNTDQPERRPQLRPA
jgi:hypothetical protein